MDDTRLSFTHKFQIGDLEGYINVGLLPNGQPGELFITISKHGGALAGVMDAIAATTSIALQYGVPLRSLVHKHAFQKFEPCGYTQNENIPYAHSILDYIFRWMGYAFIPNYNENEDKGPTQEVA